MQEDIEMRTVTLIVTTTKLNARVLKEALAKLAREMQNAKARRTTTIPHGKQTVKQLVGQNAGVANIEVTDQNIKSFDRIARKYGIDYAVKKDKTGEVPKYLIFFKARDGDALTAAFKEYSAKSIQKETERPSTISQLRKFIDMVRNMKPDPTKNKDRGREL